MAVIKQRRPSTPLLTVKVSGPEVRPGRIAVPDPLEAFHIRAVSPQDPLSTDAGSFVRGWSLDQLARLQGVDPIRNPAILAGGWPDDDDIDEALAEIYRQRE